MNTLLHFLLLLCQSCHCLRSVFCGGRISGLIKVLITVGWVWWRHQKGPLFSLASGPPTLNPPLVTSENYWIPLTLVTICHKSSETPSPRYGVTSFMDDPLSLNYSLTELVFRVSRNFNLNNQFRSWKTTVCFACKNVPSVDHKQICRGSLPLISL